MELEKLVEMAQSSQMSVTRHLTKSVMTPMIHVCLIIVPACFGFAFLFREDPFIKYALVGLGILTIVTTCGMYVYFGICKTERLQSEDYQIRQETLQMILKKGGRIVIEPVSIVDLSNPIPPSIIDKKGEPS